MPTLSLGAVVAAANLTVCTKSVDAWTDGYVLENGVFVCLSIFLNMSLDILHQIAWQRS